MRSLTPTSLYIQDYSTLGSASKVSGIAINAETGCGYVAVERLQDGVEVDILLMDPRNASDFPEVRMSSVRVRGF
jgi:hypothetical protein